jgi:hypothetical protein
LPFEEGAPATGLADLEVPAPLSEIPLFGRAGGVVPLLPEGVDTVLPAAAPTVSLAGADGSFTERDGTTYTLRGTLCPAPPAFGAALRP